MASEPRTQSKQYDYLLKFLLVGDSDVGKQEILSGLENGPSEFCSGSAYKTTTILLDGKRVKLQLWDTSGQGRFCTIIRSYSRGAQGILLVYDITNKWSFDGIGRWLKEVEEHAPGVPKVLVGNRLHLAFKRQVGAREAESYAIKNRMAFFEVSPLCNFNIRESFSELSRMALHRNGMERLLRSNKVLSLQELCCRTIVARTTVYSIEQLPLPETIKSHLKSYAMTSYSSASMLPRQSNTRLEEKAKNLTDEKKTLVKWKDSGIFKRDEFHSLCEVEDFEGGDNGSEEIIDHDLYLRIESTIVNFDESNGITLPEVVGNGFLKEVINRTIIWPMKKPNIFRGLRSPPKGVLLFGPPGTGKTLIGQSIAFQTDWTFFNISSSSLMSKWMGESEKLVRTMFAVAKARQPSLIFIDEVDSLLSYRNADEDGCIRRMKNEFLENMDGCSSEEQDRIMIIGATNRPQELDDAARQRFIKRLYIPLPDEAGRREVLMKLLESECHSLEEDDIIDIIRKTEGFSITDMKSLGQEAAMGPIKALSADAIIHLKAERIRPITMEDFMVALQLIKPSVTREELESYEYWNAKKSSVSMSSGKKAMAIYQNTPYII